MERSGRTSWASIIGLGIVMMALAGAASAQDAAGIAHDWQLGLQPAATETMERISWFHNSFLLPIITAIVILIMGLLIVVMVRFNARANPTPSRTTHNTLIEVIWTVVPVVILVAIAVPSFRLLYFQRVTPPADMTIKATGHQWFWTHEYPDHESLTFDSIMLEDDERGDRPRLLAVDNAVVVPVGKVVRIQVTADDVIHSWTIPAFGVKIDAIPGRLNEAWFKADKPGIYYGQCSELCGVRHAYMPIELHVVSEAEFATWLEQAKQEFASAPPRQEDGDTRLAAASAGRQTNIEQLGN